MAFRAVVLFAAWSIKGPLAAPLASCQCSIALDGTRTRRKTTWARQYPRLDLERTTVCVSDVDWRHQSRARLVPGPPNRLTSSPCCLNPAWSSVFQYLAAASRRVERSTPPCLGAWARATARSWRPSRTSLCITAPETLLEGDAAPGQRVVGARNDSVHNDEPSVT